jgi:hypothetical protein
VIAVAALFLVAIGHISKPVTDQVLSADYWKNWKPAIPSSLASPTWKLLVLFIAGWTICLLIDHLWLKPLVRHAEVVNTALQHLYRQWFGEEPGHRISFLAKRRFGRELRVLFRYSHGTSTKFKSKAHFPRGVAVAGISWKYPNRLVAVQIPPTAQTPATFRDFMCNTYLLTRRQADCLSDDTANTKWIMCYGIAPDGEFCGVLSIDSEDANSLSEIKAETLTACANLLGTIITAHDRSGAD